MVKLGEVGTFVRGGGFLKRDYVDKGYPCIHYGQIHMKLGVVTTRHITMIPESLAVKSKIASKGDVIIAITSEDVEGSCKSTAWMGNYDIAVGAHTAIFNHCQNPIFISYFLKSPQFNKYKAKYTRGFKVVEIKPSDIAKIEIPLPPLEEQHRIVSILDASFEKIDALKKNGEENLKNAKALFQQVLAQELKPKEGWVEKKLSEVVKHITDGDHQPPPKSNNGIPFITISNINKDSRTIDWNNCFFVPKEYFGGLKDERKPKTGDILYTVTGSYGIPVLIDSDSEFCFQRHIAIIRPNKEIVCSEFLYNWALSEYSKEQAEDTATGAAQKTVSLKSMRNFKISFPTDIEEQRRIVCSLDTLSEKCRRLEQVAQQTIRECDALKQSILRQAFSGEL